MMKTHMKITAVRMGTAGSQAGMSLIFALLALVAMTIGAVALVRSVDSGLLALGNLSFKQSGLTAGARATERAVGFLEANIFGTLLDADVPAQGYYATSLDALDPTARSASTGVVLALVDWDANGCLINGEAVAPAACLQPSAEVAVGDDRARYIVTRLCSIPGAFNSIDPGTGQQQDCASPRVVGFAVADDKGAPKPGGRIGAPSYSPYFRVITRTVGPRGTVSFTETLVHF